MSVYIWDSTHFPGFTPARIILPGINCLVDFANFVNRPGGAPLAQVPGPPCPLPSTPFHGVGATFYGVALARTNYVDGQFPLIGTPRTMLNPRQLQFAVKLIFYAGFISA